VRGRPGGEHFLDLVLQRVDVLQARGQVYEARVGQPLRLAAGDVAEVLPQLPVVGADGDVAILRLVGLVRRGAAMTGAGRDRDLAAAEVGAGFPVRPRQAGNSR